MTSVAGRVVILAADFVIQILLIVYGYAVVTSENDEQIIAGLLVWCSVGSAYWLLSVLVVAILAYRDRPEVSHPAVSWIDLNPVTRTVTGVATFLASLVGVAAAIELLFLRDDPQWSDAISFVAVWAMLLSWALFHWGFARIYARRYRRAARKPLLFPGTDDPGLIDFVYFAFAIATSFASSDVQVMTTRMRWTVTWHSAFAFFLNALLIVLVFNTIIR